MRSADTKTGPLTPEEREANEAWAYRTLTVNATEPFRERAEMILRYERALQALESRRSSQGEAAAPTAQQWEVLRDPARPNWPGVLVVTKNFHEGFISVDAGNPKNFADSKALADRIAKALSSVGEAPALTEDRDDALDFIEKRQLAIAPQVNGGWVITCDEPGRDDYSVRELARTRESLSVALRLAKDDLYPDRARSSSPVPEIYNGT
jgi:hypothetical protein